MIEEALLTIGLHTCIRIKIRDAPSPKYTVWEQNIQNIVNKCIKMLLSHIYP